MLKSTQLHLSLNSGSDHLCLPSSVGSLAAFRGCTEHLESRSRSCLRYKSCKFPSAQNMKLIHCFNLLAGSSTFFSLERVYGILFCFPVLFLHKIPCSMSLKGPICTAERECFEYFFMFWYSCLCHLNKWAFIAFLNHVCTLPLRRHVYREYVSTLWVCWFNPHHCVLDQGSVNIFWKEPEH